MATRMQQRRGLASQWAEINPVLGTGEIGFETDTNKFKIGDGVSVWQDLSYFLDETVLTGSLDEYVPLTDVGQPNGVASLDANGQVPASQLTAYATETYVNTAVSNLVDAAPATLDTLNELAAALGDDANFATTVTTALGNKQDKVSGVSDTEIGYLDGVTSAIQTQLDGKAATSHTHVMADIVDYVEPDLLPSQTGNSGKYLTTDGSVASWANVTVPSVEDNYIMSLMGAI